ncbi:MAG: hypothetical protein ABR500_04745 [Dermatophilaceae bacterium]
MDTLAVRRSARRFSAPLALLLGAMIALVAPQACAACSCLVMTFSEAADQADVVFVGTVTGREDGQGSELGPSVDYTFAVDEVYKGSADEVSVVQTADNSAACGFNFDEGETYLVMAGSSAAGLETNLCTGTTLAADVAAGDLESLGEPTDPEPVAAGAPGNTGGGAGDAGEGGAIGSQALWLGAGGLGLVALVMGLAIGRSRRRPGPSTSEPVTS